MGKFPCGEFAGWIVEAFGDGEVGGCGWDGEGFAVEGSTEAVSGGWRGVCG